LNRYEKSILLSRYNGLTVTENHLRPQSTMLLILYCSSPLLS